MMDDARITDFFASVGPVSIRPVFGGKGIYLHSKIIAFQRKDELLVKANKQGAAKIEKAGGTRMFYRSRKGSQKKVYLPYWSVPESAYDDAEEMARWVKLGVEASKRAGKWPPGAGPAVSIVPAQHDRGSLPDAAAPLSRNTILLAPIRGKATKRLCQIWILTNYDHGDAWESDRTLCA